MILGDKPPGAGLPDGTIRRSESFRLVNHARMTGFALSAARNVVSSASEFFRVEMTLRVVASNRLAMRGFVEALRGPITPFALGPTCDLAPTRTSPVMTRYSDGSVLPSGSRFAEGEAARITGAVSVGSTAVNFSGASLIPLWKVGQFFGMAGNLYMVTGLTPEFDGTMTAAFRPPCRAAVAGGDFDFAPSAVFRLTSPDTVHASVNVQSFDDVTLTADEALL